MSVDSCGPGVDEGRLHRMSVIGTPASSLVHRLDKLDAWASRIGNSLREALLWLRQAGWPGFAAFFLPVAILLSAQVWSDVHYLFWAFAVGLAVAGGGFAVGSRLQRRQAELAYDNGLRSRASAVSGIARSQTSLFVANALIWAGVSLGLAITLRLALGSTLPGLVAAGLFLAVATANGVGTFRIERSHYWLIAAVLPQTKVAGLWPAARYGVIAAERVAVALERDAEGIASTLAILGSSQNLPLRVPGFGKWEGRNPLGEFGTRLRAARGYAAIGLLAGLLSLVLALAPLPSGSLFGAWLDSWVAGDRLEKPATLEAEDNPGADANNQDRSGGSSDGKTPSADTAGSDSNSPGANAGGNDGKSSGADMAGRNGNSPGANAGGNDEKSPGADAGGSDGKSLGADAAGSDGKSPGASAGGSDGNSPGANAGGNDGKSAGADAGGSDGKSLGGDAAGSDGKSPGASASDSDGKSSGANAGGNDGKSPDADAGGNDGKSPDADAGGNDAKSPGTDAVGSEGRGPGPDVGGSDGTGPGTDVGGNDGKSPGTDVGDSDGKSPGTNTGGGDGKDPGADTAGSDGKSSGAETGGGETDESGPSSPGATDGGLPAGGIGTVASGTVQSGDDIAGQIMVPDMPRGEGNTIEIRRDNLPPFIERGARAGETLDLRPAPQDSSPRPPKEHKPRQVVPTWMSDLLDDANTTGSTP